MSGRAFSRLSLFSLYLLFLVSLRDGEIYRRRYYICRAFAARRRRRLMRWISMPDTASRRDGAATLMRASLSAHEETLPRVMPIQLAIISRRRGRVSSPTSGACAAARHGAVRPW